MTQVSAYTRDPQHSANVKAMVNVLRTAPEVIAQRQERQTRQITELLAAELEIAFLGVDFSEAAHG